MRGRWNGSNSGTNSGTHVAPSGASAASPTGTSERESSGQTVRVDPESQLPLPPPPTRRARMRWRPRVTRLSAGVFAIWMLAVGAALISTLDSYRTDDFDGLNNIFQIPFALPWFLIPIGGIWSNEVDAWIAAGMGWLNGLVILFFLPGWRARPWLPADG